MQNHVTRLRVPLDLASFAPGRWASALSGRVILEIPADYELVVKLPGSLGEVFAIQRLLTLARNRTPIAVEWPLDLLERMLTGGPLHPLLAVVLVLQRATHEAPGLDSSAIGEYLARARRQVLAYRVRGDLFSDNQVLLCADSRGHGKPLDLYDRASSDLKSREDIETMILGVLSPQLSNAGSSGPRFALAGSLAVVVAELFENTHLHGRLDVVGTPVGPDAMRGLAFKRINVTLPEHLTLGRLTPAREVPGIEISVFDTGVGYFASYTRQDATVERDLSIEWKVLHNCFARHFHPEVQDLRHRQRGMGLYEVLRALQELKGSIEVRTGRLYAYRTFVEGELQPQMRPPSGPWAQINLPKPVLLDMQNRFAPIPTGHDPVVGAAVRIIVPLA